MKTIISTLFIFSILYGYSQSSGSFYSAYGLGTIKSPAVGILEGMGGTGIGLRSPNFVNTVNPAANVFLQLPTTMTLDAGIYIEATQAQTHKESALQSGGGLSHLVLWMQPNKFWGTSVGLLPFSEVNYNINANRYNDVLQADYDVIYNGSGGLNRFFWSNAFRPVNNLSVGINVSFLFGAIEKTENVTAGASIQDFATYHKTNFADLLVDLGLQYSVRFGNKSLVLGAILQPASDLASAEERWLQQENGERIEEEVNEKASYRLPMRTGFGLSWNTKRMTIAYDMIFEKWADAQLNTQHSLNNTVRWSLGGEWALTEESYLFYQKPLLVRGGVFVQNYHQTIEGNRFAVWGFSVGASLPIRRKLHHMSVNYNFQQNGTKADNLLLESTHRLTLNINLRDIWFQKRWFD